MKKTIRTFLLLSLRLWRQWSFRLLLLLIPLCVLGFALLSHGDSGVLHILLCASDPADTLSESIITSLAEGESLISYEKVESESAAVRAVAEGQADAAWIFPSDMGSVLRAFAAGRADELCRVVERDDNVSLRLSHEELCGVIFSHLSYEIYRDFLINNTDAPDEEAMRASYDAMRVTGSLFRFENVSGAPVKKSGGYLMIPLRGILALCVLLCSLSAAVTFLSDKEAGLYDARGRSERFRFLFLTSLAASLCACVLSYAGLLLLKGTNAPLGEGLRLLLFAFTCAAFSSLSAVIARRADVLGAALPPLLLALLAVSPIFLHIGALHSLQAVTPLYWYLAGSEERWALPIGALYTLSLFGVAVILDRLNTKRSTH